MHIIKNEYLHVSKNEYLHEKLALSPAYPAMERRRQRDRKKILLSVFIIIYSNVNTIYLDR